MSVLNHNNLLTPKTNCIEITKLNLESSKIQKKDLQTNCHHSEM